MFFALFVYVLCGFSGWIIERCFAINSLVKRSLIFFAAAAAQLMLSVQLLSLARVLTIPYLIVANLAFSAIVAAVARKRLSPERLPWRRLIGQRWKEVRFAFKDFSTLSLCLFGALFLTSGIIAGWFLFILNDAYHFEMPRFWMQHATILPFPFPNSRHVALSFLSEVLQLPGYMARLESVSIFATLLTSILALGVIFSLALRIGATAPAAASAAAMSLGCSTFASNLHGAGVDMVVQGLCVGGSLIFLMDFASGRFKSTQRLDLAASFFLFVMACGSKNSAMLLAPVYVVLVAAACWKQKSEPDARAVLIRRFATTAMIAGIAGALFTGAAWNNVSNKIWFGSRGLPKMLRGTVAQEFGPREVWTRICRGVVQIAGDTLYIPRSVRPRYESIALRAVTVLGGKSSLPEDTEFYSFRPAPFRGLGLVGIFLFFPAIVWGIIRTISLLKSRRADSSTFNMSILVATALGAFLITHIVLRWQAGGVIRLMFPFVIVAGSLTAILFEKKIVRLLAVPLFAATTLVYLVYWAGHIARRNNWVDKPILSQIARLQNAHSYTATVQRKGQPGYEIFIPEDFRLSLYFFDILKHSKQPAVFGLIGHDDSYPYDLFGERSQNRILALVDCRNSEKIMNPPGHLDYVVAEDRFAEARAWAQVHGFEETASYESPEREMFVTFAKKSP